MTARVEWRVIGAHEEPTEVRTMRYDSKQDADLCKEVLEALPVGIAMQDEGGAFLLLNDVAAAAMSPPHPVLRSSGSPAPELIGAEEVLSRARLEAIRSSLPVAAEYTTRVAGATRTLLTTYKAVTIGGEKRLISATVDITERKTLERKLAHGPRRAYNSRLQIEQQLRAAVCERRFQAALQPKVDIETGRILGFEALARWVDAAGTIHLPGMFIEIASEIGVLNDITSLILENVTTNIPHLQQWYGHDVSVSVNLSAHQVDDRRFLNAFLAQLADSGVAESIIVELTEDALVATHRFQRTVLPTLRGLGVRVSIDDFGTGYSSLSTLADITADEVKVDRAFISSIHTRSRSQGILRAIESLCSALEITIVAEGVESDEELAYLREHTSIRLAQGFLFGRPQFMDSLRPAPCDTPDPRQTSRT